MKLFIGEVSHFALDSVFLRHRNREREHKAL